MEKWCSRIVLYPQFTRMFVESLGSEAGGLVLPGGCGGVAGAFGVVEKLVQLHFILIENKYICCAPTRIINTNVGKILTWGF